MRISYANGSNIHFHSQTPGLYPGYIFTTFCGKGPNQCENKFVVNMLDSWGDGWNGNILGFQQDH